MTVTIPQVEASRPEGLTKSAAELGQKASSLASQIDKQRATLDGLRTGWQGTASDAAIAKAQPTLLRMQRIYDALNSAQTVLRQGASTLAQTRTTVLQRVSQLSGQGWQVGPDGTVSVRAGSPLDQYARISPVNAMKLRQLAATNSANVKALLAGFDTTDRVLSQNLRTAVGGLDSPPAHLDVGEAPPPEAPPYDDGSQIPVGKDPKDVNEWWKSLTDDQRANLLDDWPDKLGNLDGIPVADRDKANLTVMHQDIDRVADVAAARSVTVDDVLAHPDRYGMNPQMMSRYHNALKVQEALRVDHEKTRAPTFLQVYEPEEFKGDGRAAIAIGDPDRAANTAVVVPGTGNSVGSGWLEGDDATNLYNETKAADPSRSTAVVAWMGYDAPDALYDPRVGTTGLAHDGGQLLASDVNALNATHEGAAHMTVLGHSYGSTTVSDAAAGYGMHADDVVLVGCPGTDMAHSAADFHLNEGGHLYVGAASSDPVTQLSAIPQLHVPGTDFTASLGDDPAVDGYGSTRFKAEVPGLTTPWGDHSQYYTRGGESLFSMSDIASGHGDALEHDGMTAPHRGGNVLTDLANIFGVPAIDDPEVFRTGTSGHEHEM
jgi:WXG100 family type VII secretion target